MKKTTLSIISILITVFFIAIIVWNMMSGRYVKEVVMPNGAAVKFGDKNDNNSLEKNNKEVTTVRPNANATTKTHRGKLVKDIEERTVEQHTTGPQSPAVISGRDTNINYGDK